MEETPVRPSTQQGGKRITQVEPSLLQHCVNAVLVHSIRVGKLPEQVAAEGLKLGITIEVNGSTFTTAPTTAMLDEATHDPVTGSVQRCGSHGGRHGTYTVRMDNVDVLLPGARRRSERYGKPPAFIANPRELREGVKITLHSMDATHTIFGSTICVCSGESSFMSYPRGEATVDFRVFSCEDGVVNMEPLYNRTNYVKTYLGEDPREMIQNRMAAERAKRKETAKLRVERVSLDEVEELELDNASDSTCLEAEIPEGSPYMAEGGDGKVVVPPTTLQKVHREPQKETARRVDDHDDGDEEKEDPWVAEASHIAVEGSLSAVSASGAPDFRADVRPPLPQSTHPSVPLEKANASKGEEARTRMADPIVTIPLGGGTPPPHPLRNEGAGEEEEEVEEEAEWEREAQSTEAYTQALTAQVDRIRAQSAPHFPDRLTSVMRSLVPCTTTEKLDAAFELYDVEKKGLLTREQLVHFCRAHQPYADWCADDDTLLLSLAPYIPSSLLEMNALTVTGGGEGGPEEGNNAYDLSGKEEQKEESEEDANGVNGGSSSHGTGQESAISFPRLNVNYLYYHPENRSAPLQINREFFDVIGLRLAGS